MAKIFIAEDDEVLYKELEKLFKNNHYEIIDGRKYENIYKEFDLALLDIGMPKINGYDLCLKIKEIRNCPILFLTSQDKPENELMAFAVGADDFIKKPFNSAVLLARIARYLRNANQESIVFGKLTLDMIRLVARNEQKSVNLSKTEFGILKILIDYEGIISPKDLIERLWDNEAYIDENTLYVNIKRLRDKLKEIDLTEAIINVRGAGYRLEC